MSCKNFLFVFLLTYAFTVFAENVEQEGVVATASGNQVSVTWKGSDRIKAYNIYRKIDDGVFKLIEGKSPWTNYTDYTVFPGKHYTYEVYALAGDHETERIGEGTVLPMRFTSDPLAGQESKTSINLTWKAVPDAKKYLIKIGTKSNFYTKTLSDVTAPYSLVDLNSSSVYYLRIYAVNFEGGGATAASSEVRIDLGLDQTSISASGPIIADGFNRTEVRISVHRDGSPVPGETPIFQATDTDLTNTYSPCSVTDGEGVSLCYFSSTRAEMKTIRLIYPIDSATTTVNFIPGLPATSYSTINGTPITPADGTTTAAVRISLRDKFRNPIAGVVPSFSANDREAGNLYGTCSATDSSGESNCQLSSVVPGKKTLTMTSPIVLDGSIIEFVK